MVPHHSTDYSRPDLTAEIERDLVFVRWYGRNLKVKADWHRYRRSLSLGWAWGWGYLSYLWPAPAYFEVTQAFFDPRQPTRDLRKLFVTRASLFGDYISYLWPAPAYFEVTQAICDLGQPVWGYLRLLWSATAYFCWRTLYFRQHNWIRLNVYPGAEI